MINENNKGSYNVLALIWVNKKLKPGLYLIVL